MASIDEAIEIIRETPISSIIGFYHSISKKGLNFEAICPFHSDTKPSLKINDDKKIYKCFACGAGGDAIRFVMDYQSIEFVDAIKEIASKLSIQIEEKKKPKDPKYEMALRVVKAANRIYYKAGHDHKSPAFTEFLERRKISKEIAKEFELGFAPPNNALFNYLQTQLPESVDKKLALESAEKIGIVRKSQKGSNSHYDFFRDRITFPVWDHSGSIRGFSCRAVREDQVPKYLNSGESFIFDKRNIVYGFNIAKKYIRESSKVIICEGHMDVVSLHQFGFRYSVGTQGVALSENCARLLANSAPHIYLGMDSDQAGFDAAKRINDIFLRLGTFPKYISYAPEKDPDDFLKAYGRLELEERIENAPIFTDYLIEKVISESNLETVDHKLEVLNEVFKILSPMGDDLRAKEKAIEASQQIGLNSSNEDIVKAYLEQLDKSPKLANTIAAQSEPELNQEEIVNEAALKSAYNQTLSHDAPISKSELVILEQILTYPEFILAKQMPEILDLIDHFEVKRLIQWLKKIYLEIDESDYEIVLNKKLLSIDKIDLKEAIAKAVSQHSRLKLDAEIVEKTVNDFCKKLKLEKLKKEKDFLKLKQKESSTEQESQEFLIKILELEKEIRNVKFKS